MNPINGENFNYYNGCMSILQSMCSSAQLIPSLSRPPSQETGTQNPGAGRQGQIP